MTEETTFNTAPITAHIDTYLGEIKDGWRPGAGADGLSIALFSHVPAPAWCVIGSYGLSLRVLEQDNGPPLRQELLLCWPEEDIADSVLSHFNAVGQMLMQTGKVVARGALLAIPEEPRLQSWGDRPWAAWYITMPYFLPDKALILTEIDPPLLLTWLLPIYEDEADFVVTEGPEAFDALILEKKAEIFRKDRPSLLPAD